MHEWALAEGIIATALKAAEKENFQGITKIKIKLGELQQVDEDIVKFALNEIAKFQSPMLKQTAIELENERAVLKCRVCGHRWAFSDVMKELSEEDSESIHFVPDIAHVYIRCPECNSPDFEIVEGRGVWIEYIEGE